MALCSGCTGAFRKDTHVRGCMRFSTSSVAAEVTESRMAKHIKSCSETQCRHWEVRKVLPLTFIAVFIVVQCTAGPGFSRKIHLPASIQLSDEQQDMQVTEVSWWAAHRCSWSCLFLWGAWPQEMKWLMLPTPRALGCSGHPCCSPSQQGSWHPHWWLFRGSELHVESSAIPKKFHMKGTLMCPLSLWLSCTSSILLLVHSSLTKDSEKPKPNTSISFLSSLEPFLLLHPWMTFWTLWLFLWNMDSTFFCTVHNNLFWAQYSCREMGMLHPDCPSLNLLSPSLRCVAISAWSAAPGAKPLEAFVTQALVALLEISCDGLTAFTVHLVLLIP